MVTIVSVKNTSIKGDALFELRGKSTDTKPKGYYVQARIGNGSSFLEMDTSKMFMFDADRQIWLEM